MNKPFACALLVSAALSAGGWALPAVTEETDEFIAEPAPAPTIEKQTTTTTTTTDRKLTHEDKERMEKERKAAERLDKAERESLEKFADPYNEAERNVDDD